MAAKPDKLSNLYTADDPVETHLDRARQQFKYPVYAMLPPSVGAGASLLFYENNGPFMLQYGVPMGIALVGMAVAAEVRADRRIRKSYEQARTIEKALGEPIDVITARGASGESTGCIRWYGLDGLEELPLSATTRLQRLAAWGAEHGVSEVAIATSWMDDEQRTRAQGDTYRYYDAKTALSELKGSTTTKLIDKAVSDEVLVASPDALLELFDQDVDRVNALLSLLDDKYLLELYEQSHGGNVAALAKLKRSIALRLADTLDEGAQREVTRERDGTRRFTKTSAQLSVQGTSIKRLIQGVPHEAGRESIRVGESTNLFSRLGVRDLPELLAKLDVTDGSESLCRADVLAAVHLLLDDTYRELQKYDGEVGTAPSGTVEPLYARLETNEKDVQVSASPSRLIRRVGATFVAAALPIGLGAGAYYHIYESRSKDAAYAKAYNEGAEYFDGTVSSRQYKKYLAFLEAEYGSEAADMRRLLDMYDGLSELDRAYGEYLLATFRKLFTPESPVDLWWQQRDEYQTGDTMSFGDVEATEHTMYTVTSLKGKSTAGYWTTGVSKQLSLSSTSGEPVMQGYYDGYVVMPPQQATRDKVIAQADFMVELPSEVLTALQHERPINTLDIPVKQNTVPTMVEVVDAANPELVTTVPFFRALTETYSVDLRPEDSVVNGVAMEQPVLRYWLKEDKRAVSARAIGPMSIVKKPVRQTTMEDGKLQVIEYTFDLEASDLRTIASKARRALGLSETATAEEVYQAIRSKQYSYTPFKDAGVEPFKDIRYMNDEEALAALGQALADLESLNCNLATLLAVLAQADRPVPFINAAIGYNNDGDGELTNKERHAWTVDRTGTILDPTPSGSGTATPEASSPDMGSSMPLGVAGLVAAATVLAAYRRRDQLGALSDKVRTRIATSGPNFQSDSSILAGIRWSDAADEAARVDLASVRTDIPFDPKRPWQQYVANIGPKGVRIAEVQQYAKATRQKLPARLAAVAWLLQANHAAIRRHAARTEQVS